MKINLTVGVLLMSIGYAIIDYHSHLLHIDASSTQVGCNQYYSYETEWIVGKMNMEAWENRVCCLITLVKYMYIPLLR